MAKDFHPERDALDEEHEEWLPKRGDRLFVPSDAGARLDPLGFTAPGEPRSPIGRWQLYSDAFLHAADRLVDTTSGAPHEDELIYPILALYRHHLELGLKWLIRFCAGEKWAARLLENPQALARWTSLVSKRIRNWDRQTPLFEQLQQWLDNEHDLKRLWRGLLEIYPDGIRRASRECTEACVELISEFNAIDPNSQATRYPWDKGRNQTLIGLDIVDAGTLKLGVNKISHYLSTIAEQVGEDRDSENEMSSW